MPFEPEWLYLDELLALLGPSPDLVQVEATFRRALDEGALRDRDGTPPDVWHRRFEIGDVPINFATGMMFVPWYDRARPERNIMPIHPQFRRADWLALFSMAPLEERTMEEVPTQEVHEIKRWFLKEYVPSFPPGQKPSEADQVAAATKRFPDVKAMRAIVRRIRPDEWSKPGPNRKP